MQVFVDRARDETEQAWVFCVDIFWTPEVQDAEVAGSPCRLSGAAQRFQQMAERGQQAAQHAQRAVLHQHVAVLQAVRQGRLRPGEPCGGARTSDGSEIPLGAVVTPGCVRFS